MAPDNVLALDAKPQAEAIVHVVDAPGGLELDARSLRVAIGGFAQRPANAHLQALFVKLGHVAEQNTSALGQRKHPYGKATLSDSGLKGFVLARTNHALQP